MTSDQQQDQVRRSLEAAQAERAAFAARTGHVAAVPRPAPPPAARAPTPLVPGPTAAPVEVPAAAPTAPRTMTGLPAAVAQPVGWAAGLLAVAGIIHLVLLPGHLEQARGIGLYFCAIGAAQVVWALLFALSPTRRLAWIGLVALAVQPVAVYVLTRLVRQPFGDHAEDVDLIGIVTGIMELAAIVPFGLYLSATREPGTTAARGVALPLAVGIVAGLVFGAALYGAGLVAEELFPWLEEPEAPHQHEHVASVTAAAAGAGADGLAAPSGHSHDHG